MQPVLVPYHLDEYLPDLDVPLEPSHTVTRVLRGADVWERIAPLYDAVANLVAAAVAGEQLSVVMSGDCTTSLGIASGLQRAGVVPSVVWFDGHGDLQTLETTTSGYVGGFPLRILVGYRPELISDRLGLVPVPEHQVVLVDARDLDPPERKFLHTSPIRRLPVDELVPAQLPDGPLYLHVDCDVVTPEDLPGLLFPATGGPAMSDVAAAIVRVMATGRVVAVGLACTWHPHRGAADRTRQLVNALAGTESAGYEGAANE
ncbi:MAG: arginase family protein [Acidimicrobiales bacterium]